MQQRKYRKHDRHRDQCRARHHHEGHVDEQGESDGGEQQGQRDPLCPQQHDDRVGQRDRAQREFLALGYVVLDEDAALGEVGSRNESSGRRNTIQDISINSVQETRNATNTHVPRVERPK